MTLKHLSIFTLIVLFSAVLAACTTGGADAAPTIEAYIEAVVSQDMDSAATLSCTAWEADAQTEVRAFDGVTARLEGLTCQVGSTEGETALVTCSGTIVATYNGEDRPLPLDGRSYVAVEEGGEWRMCGYR